MSQITTKTMWFLLLVVIISYQIVDGQSVTSDEMFHSEFLRHEMETLSFRQQQIFEQLQLITKPLGKWKAYS